MSLLVEPSLLVNLTLLRRQDHERLFLTCQNFLNHPIDS